MKSRSRSERDPRGRSNCYNKVEVMTSGQVLRLVYACLGYAAAFHTPKHHLNSICFLTCICDRVCAPRCTDFFFFAYDPYPYTVCGYRIPGVPWIRIPYPQKAEGSKVYGYRILEMPWIQSIHSIHAPPGDGRRHVLHQADKDNNLLKLPPGEGRHTRTCTCILTLFTRMHMHARTHARTHTAAARTGHARIESTHHPPTLSTQARNAQCS